MSWGRVLLIEEDALLRRMITEYFEQKGLFTAPLSRADGLAASAAARSDVLLLSGSIADGLAPAMAHKLSRVGSLPVIVMRSMADSDGSCMLSVQGEIAKPFDMLELYSMVLSVLKGDGACVSPTAAYYGLSVDMLSLTAEADGIKAVLSSSEIELLHLLVSCPSRVFSREEIASRIWGRLLADDRVVSVCINHIRKQIGRYRDNIVTVRGVGYMFSP